MHSRCYGMTAGRRPWAGCSVDALPMPTRTPLFPLTSLGLDASLASRLQYRIVLAQTGSCRPRRGSTGGPGAPFRKQGSQGASRTPLDYCCTMVISSDGGRVVLFYRYFLPSEHVGDETLQFFQRNSTHYLVELLKHQQVGRCDDT